MFMTYQRTQVSVLRSRLAEAPRFIHIVAGPRQVGKTTLVRQAIDGLAHKFVSVDPQAMRLTCTLRMHWKTPLKSTVRRVIPPG